MHDVAIVGAGPAGAWTACCLARRGARVLLVDPSHPREKPCGGGVTTRALSLVGDCGVCPATTIRAARFTSAAAASDATVTLDDALVVASRQEFDGALLAAARRSGADVLEARVTGVVHAPRGVRIETTAGPRDAAWLVGADGANGIVRRRLAAPFRRDQLSIATGYFAHGITSDEIAIEFSSDPAGYIWSFPRPTHLAIGMCAQADGPLTTSALRASVREWIARTGIGRDGRLEAYSWPIPSLAAHDFASLPIAGARWTLVGDAAGLVDPITREGIFFALLSGQWAADACGAGDVSRYVERVRDEIGSELARAAQLKAAFFRPAFVRLLMGALQQSASIRAVMADLIAGRQGYAGLKWRLLKTLELRLAWRALASAQP